MPQIKSSFILNSKEPNFTRDRFNTYQEMIGYDKNHIDEGHISYCAERKRHYIFKDNNWSPLTSQDILQQMTAEEMESYDSSTLPLGSLIYCKSDNTLYYNIYPSTGELGYFNKLITDIDDSQYIKNNEDDWLDLNELVNNTELIYFETINDLKNYSDELEHGQMVFCREINQYFYYHGTNEGWYGRFRLVCDKSLEVPVITQPSIEIKIDENASVDGWVLYNRNDEYIWVITDDTNIDDIDNINCVSSTIQRGLIDYSHYPYKGDLQPTQSYTNDGDWLINLVTSGLVMGDNHRIVQAKTNANTQVPQVLDINGIRRPELEWNKSTILESNTIIINKTAPWKVNGVEQSLIPWGDEMIGYSSFNASCKGQQRFEIPVDRSLKNVYIKLLGNYVSDTKNYSRSGNAYTYNGETRGAVEIKVVF